MPQLAPRTTPTFKQKQFAKHYVANGGNATQAALQTYDADYNNAHAIAGKNLTKPIVQQEIDKLLKATGLSSEAWIATQLKKSIDTGMGVKATQKDSLTALNMLLKVTDTYPTKKSMSMRVNINGELTPKNTSDLISSVKSLSVKSQELVEDLSS